MATKKKAAAKPKNETAISSDTQVVMPNGKTVFLHAGLTYKNLPQSVLDQIK